MPQSMQVVRGLLAANPDYWPAKANADGTTSSAYLRATVYEDRPRVRQKDGSYTDNPLGPVRTTVKFWGQAAELLHGMDFRQGDAVVATGRMDDPDAFISQKDGKAYARPVVIGDSMQIDSIVSQRIQLARERKRQDKEQAGAVADAFSGATPLAAVKFGAVSASAIDYQDMLFGSIPGSLGEVAALALLAGFVYLLWRRVITWHVPVTILATMALFAFFVALGRGWTGSLLYEFPAFHVLAGGAILGAVFMATDYSTSPMTVRGGVIYAVGIGVITMCIRLWGAYPEGMSFAILVMNATVPLINRSVKPKRFGAKK